MLCILLCLLLLCSCTRPQKADADVDVVTDSASIDDTSLYNQGRTSSCWIYAMLTCIEEEQRRQGDSITLSRQWLMARLMEEQTIASYLTHGEWAITMRGVGPDVIRLIEEYGLVPYMHEKTHITNSRVLERKLRIKAENARDVESLRKDISELLPQFTIARHNYDGKVMDGGGSFYYYSMRYTPMQFAESVMYNQHWTFYASSPYHPWYSPFALEVADNRRYHTFINLPPDSLEQKVVRSVKAGHPVYWEHGKNHSSAHAMSIIGMKAVNGEPMFICRNTYGKSWGNHGHCLIPMKTFRKLTCNVGIVE